MPVDNLPQFPSVVIQTKTVIMAIYQAYSHSFLLFKHASKIKASHFKWLLGMARVQ